MLSLARVFPSVLPSRARTCAWARSHSIPHAEEAVAPSTWLSPAASLPQAALSGTAIVLAGSSAAVTPTCSGTCTFFSNATTIVVKNVSLGSFAREQWALSLSANGAEMSWTVRRTYLANVTLVSDRLALGLATVAVPGLAGSQIPSYLDPWASFDEAATTGFAVPGAGFFEFLSNGSAAAAPTVPPVAPGDGRPSSARYTWVRWAPSDADTILSLSQGLAAAADPPPLFSFAKPGMDGTAGSVSIGAQLVDPRKGRVGKLRAAGTTVSMTLVLRMATPEAGGAPSGVPPSPFPVLNFTLPRSTANDALVSTLQQFVRVHNQVCVCVGGGRCEGPRGFLHRPRLSPPVPYCCCCVARSGTACSGATTPRRSCACRRSAGSASSRGSSRRRPLASQQ